MEKEPNKYMSYKEFVKVTADNINSLKPFPRFMTKLAIGGSCLMVLNYIFRTRIDISVKY